MTEGLPKLADNIRREAKGRRPSRLQHAVPGGDRPPPDAALDPHHDPAGLGQRGGRPALGWAPGARVVALASRPSMGRRPAVDRVLFVRHREGAAPSPPGAAAHGRAGPHDRLVEPPARGLAAPGSRQGDELRPGARPSPRGHPSKRPRPAGGKERLDHARRRRGPGGGVRDGQRRRQGAHGQDRERHRRQGRGDPGAPADQWPRRCQRVPRPGPPRRSAR